MKVRISCAEKEQLLCLFCLPGSDHSPGGQTGAAHAVHAAGCLMGVLVFPLSTSPVNSPESCWNSRQDIKK